MMKIIIETATMALTSIVNWVSYTLTAIPSPKPIEEVKKEIEEEQSLLNMIESRSLISPTLTEGVDKVLTLHLS